MSALWTIYSTFSKKAEAVSAAKVLVDKHLVACANIFDQATSVYRWQGAVRKESEAILIAKTSKEKISAAIETLRQLHSYDLPCITAWPIADGFPPFMEWVREETR